MSHLVLIDGYHLMYRAYWAIPRTLKTSQGEQVNTVFGVASMLLSIYKKERPDAVLMCLDKGEETFRHVEYATYKAGRAETPDDFYIQIPRVLELFEAWKIPTVSDTRFEADDFLCTYALAGRAAGMRVSVVTGDRDALQLAGEGITIVIPHKGYTEAEYLDAAAVEKKYGIRPDQVPAYKGLTGDPSDNLPGVHGIGPKTAAKLLQEYESLEGIYNHIAEIAPRVQQKLFKDREQAFFCQRLAQLVCDIPLPIPLSALVVSLPPYKSIRLFLQNMEFTLLLKRLEDFSSTHMTLEGEKQRSLFS